MIDTLIIPFNESYEYLKSKIKQYESSVKLNLEIQIRDLRTNKFKTNFKNNYEGRIFNSKSSGEFKVLEYFNYDKILIEFIDTGYRMLARANNINHGEVRDPYAISILGVGYIGVGPYKTDSSSFDKMIYSRWRGIIERCYIIKEGNKYMHPEWFNYQYFAAWFYSEFYIIPEYSMYEMCVDKDILYPRNQEYSPYKCLIIPNFINNKIQLKEFDRDRISKLEYELLDQRELNKIYNHKQYREAIVRNIAEEYKSILPTHVYKALKEYRMF